jgi:hypothetical protein
MGILVLPYLLFRCFRYLSKYIFHAELCTLHNKRQELEIL